ncbi:YkuS family protein [Vallitalea pronyensis]|uniref:YkuS family protein n=1 Tax=Vallitalea pronyensis TaxID=1348613 RepID=A0A8J8MMA5_9FIRM|nr:YkuS family protein [Vallitalea pronyensis]QUI24300.1 YkuS family protein [Vallitalea pronyensis]
MKHIAVERELTPIREYLEEKGYDVETFEGTVEDAWEHYSDIEAIVITGMSEDMLGIQDTLSKAIVIDADGMTPEEVEERIEHESNWH